MDMDLEGRIAIITGSLFGLFIIARIVRAWARRGLTRVRNLSKLLSDFLVMAGFVLLLKVVRAGFIIAFITVSYQTIRAAVSNPVNALRYE